MLNYIWGLGMGIGDWVFTLATTITIFHSRKAFAISLETTTIFAITSHKFFICGIRIGYIVV